MVTVKYAVSTPVEPVEGEAQAVESHSTLRIIIFSHPPTAAELRGRILNSFPQGSQLFSCCSQHLPLDAHALVQHDLVLKVVPNLPRESVQLSCFTYNTHFDAGRLKVRILIENVRDKLACEVGLTFDTRYSEGLLLSHLKAQHLNLQPVQLVGTYIRDHENAAAHHIPTFSYGDLRCMLMLKPHDCCAKEDRSSHRKALIWALGMEAKSLGHLIMRDVTPQIEVGENCLAHLEGVEDEEAPMHRFGKRAPTLIKVSLLEHAPHDYPCEALLGRRGMEALRLGVDPQTLRLVHKLPDISLGFLTRMQLGLVP